MNLCGYVHIRVRGFVCLYTCTCLHVYVCVQVYMCVYICVCIYTYARVVICGYVYLYTRAGVVFVLTVLAQTACYLLLVHVLEGEQLRATTSVGM